MAKSKKATKTISKKRVTAKPKKNKVIKKNTKLAVKKQNTSRKKHTTPRQPRQEVKKSFTKNDLEHFKKIIMERRQEILDELEALKSTMMDVTTGQYEIENSTYSLHMEQGTDAMEREKTFLFASREGKFLNYLDDALKRIENGTYGYCTECGNLIDKERLEAVPHAHLCVQCKLKKK
ncbi:MAG TPA: TraR/DksA family transcriptional regulator [Bacteroidota bacterium]|nr:TraR/DksA family transcriptional regulator [Bacteroidota bacterium]